MTDFSSCSNLSYFKVLQEKKNKLFIFFFLQILKFQMKAKSKASGKSQSKILQVKYFSCQVQNTLQKQEYSQLLWGQKLISGHLRAKLLDLLWTMCYQSNPIYSVFTFSHIPCYRSQLHEMTCTNLGKVGCSVGCSVGALFIQLKGNLLPLFQLQILL